MYGFLGIDIGTTNSKAILINEDGDIVSTWKQKTPQVLRNGHSYFDIQKIEVFIDQWTEEAKRLVRLRSISFSSIGESVIPLKDGKVIGLPLVWHEQTDEIDETVKRRVLKDSGFEHTGVHDTPTFAVYKMTWMMKHELTELPDMWLPISSYLIYRKTGTARWDTSQAGRSYLYDIHKKEWNRNAAEELDIGLPEQIGSMGDVCGCKDGIVYGLGGHDHYVGMYAVRKLFGQPDLFYDSMGSSSVLAMNRRDCGKKLRGTATYNPLGGCLVTGFGADEYAVNRALDFYGRVLNCITSFSRRKKDKILFDEVNRQLDMNLPDTEQLCRIACPKDYGPFAARVQDINLLDVKEHISFPVMLLSGYVYMVLGTQRMYGDLSQYCDHSQDKMPYFTGGGITDNHFFMQLKAAALNREMTILKTAEISSLGAAISGMCACGEEARLKELGSILLEGEKVIPNTGYMEYIAEMKRRYEAG